MVKSIKKVGIPSKAWRKKDYESLDKFVKANSPIMARIKVLGKLYEATGLTVAEAISNLKPLKGRGVSVLTVSKDGQERSKVLNPSISMRLFSPSQTAREMGLKSVISMFSDL